MPSTESMAAPRATAPRGGCKASTTRATSRTRTGVPFVARTTVLSMSLGRAQVAARAHDELGLAVAQVAARGRAVRLRDDVDEVLEREAEVAQLRRVGEHVVLLDEAAEADDVGDARRRA